MVFMIKNYYYKRIFSKNLIISNKHLLWFQEILLEPRGPDHSRILWVPITMMENATSNGLWLGDNPTNNPLLVVLTCLDSLEVLQEGGIGGTSHTWGWMS